MSKAKLKVAILHDQWIEDEQPAPPPEEPAPKGKKKPRKKPKKPMEDREEIFAALLLEIGRASCRERV